MVHLYKINLKAMMCNWNFMILADLSTSENNVPTFKDNANDASADQDTGGPSLPFLF